MKKITIPIEFGQPVATVWINDEKYVLETGKEIEVDDHVADFITRSINSTAPNMAPGGTPFNPDPLLTAPLVLDADKSAEYDADPSYGDIALKAIRAGRKILVRVPNADGGKFTAIYSPVLTYQLPNYANDYLYLFYLRDEKQNLDLSAVGMGTINVPIYGELQMKLSETYNDSPLNQPYIDSEPSGSVGGSSDGSTGVANGGGFATPVFFATDENGLKPYGEDRFATFEEIASAYMEGRAYVVNTNSWQERFPRKIIGFDDNEEYKGCAIVNGAKQITLYPINDFAIGMMGPGEWMNLINSIVQKYSPDTEIN